jgi:hypothetical protein
MSIVQFLPVCFAAVMIFYQLKLALAPAKWRGATSVSIWSLLTVIAAALCFATGAAAQETPAVSDSASISPAEAIIIPPDVMGFERLGTWTVGTSAIVPGFNVQSTTARTQGNAAYAVYDAPTLFQLTSSPVANTATALTGVGNSGAQLQLDVELPCELLPTRFGAPASCGPANTGWIEGFVSSKSRGLNSVSLGKVSFSEYRLGIYNTISFTIPESVSSALNKETFTDLVFTFEVSSSSRLPAPFLFDNLRVHSVELVQTPKGVAPPAGYGGSVDLTVTGNKPVKQTFNLGPIQIPAGLHLKKGAAGTTTLQLEAGLDSNTAFTCTYEADTSDKSGQSYKLESCTGTYVAGDLINANWVSLAIVGGETTQQVYAQLVLSPLGDLTGSGLLPPMPTFWGSANSCSPTPVAGKVVTKSTSCSSQTAQANTIITNYFNQVNSAHPSPNWIVAPVAESALRLGDGKPANAVTSTTPNSGSNIPFSTGGDLNPGGSFDAYWKLSGNLTPTAVTGTDENLTHFDAAFTAHGVLFGDDVDVVDAKVTADTDSGETTPIYKPATSSGTLGFYVFGEEIPSGGLDFNPSIGFSVDPSWSQEYDLPSIQVWIFDLTLGAFVDADLKAQGSAALSGADLSVTPSASLGAHVSGGINIEVASGDVDAKVNLITVSTPLTAQAKWVINNDPEICAATLNGSLEGNVNVSSGGGQVDLDATFGHCPFCLTDSWTLFKWNALASESWTLFNDTIDTQLFGLPASMCQYTATTSIISPTSGQTLSASLPFVMTGSAKPNETSLPYTSTYIWTFAPGANASTVTVNSGATTANPSVTFGPAKSGNTSTWTIHLTATTTARSAGGTTITETTSAAPVTITVNNLSAGVHIAGISGYYSGPATQDGSGVYQVGNAPGAITISGLVSGVSGTLNTTFTIAPCNDGTAACTSPGAATTLTTTGPTTTTPSATWTGFSGGYFKFTMTTKSGATTLGTATAIIYGTEII